LFVGQVPTQVDECDGLEKLEQLQEHENHNVYTKSVHLIETFFGAEDEVFLNVMKKEKGAQFALK
jgi:hypothetical protein